MNGWRRVHEGAQTAHFGSSLPSDTLGRVNPTWLWMQVVIVVFVVAGMIIAIVKLA
jgi:hypothetical protein